MRLTYKFRIYPTAAQETSLENMFSMCRHLYNWSLQERIEAYEKEQATVSYYQQQNALPKLKKERPWYKGVYSLALQDVLRRLDGAYQKFFRNKKGFPKFKKRGQWNSLTYPDHKNLPMDGFLQVAKVGRLKIVYHRVIPECAQIKTLTLVKEGCKYFACFSLDLPDRTEPKLKPEVAIGIDLGLNHFIFASDGDSLAAPKFLRKRLKDIKRLQRKLSHTPKRTNAYMKVLRALQKAFYRTKCQRSHFFYETAHKLLSRADVIIHENLSIAGMVKRPAKEVSNFQEGNVLRSNALRRSIYDAAWGTFLLILRSTANRLGKCVVGIDPHYTSQECSVCRNVVSKGLSTRTHCCEYCGYVANRDYNAARNILRLGLESLGQSLEAPTIVRST